MMKSIRTLVRQDREKYVIPRRVQDVIPIQKIWEDGIFLTGGRYAKSFRFTDINYQVASEPDKEKMNNLFHHDSEFSEIHQQAFSSIVEGTNISSVRKRYNLCMDAYWQKHLWDD